MVLEAQAVHFGTLMFYATIEENLNRGEVGKNWGLFGSTVTNFEITDKNCEKWVKFWQISILWADDRSWTGSRGLTGLEVRLGSRRGSGPRVPWHTPTVSSNHRHGIRTNTFDSCQEISSLQVIEITRTFPLKTQILPEISQSHWYKVYIAHKSMDPGGMVRILSLSLTKFQNILLLHQRTNSMHQRLKGPYLKGSLRSFSLPKILYPLDRI